MSTRTLEKRRLREERVARQREADAAQRRAARLKLLLAALAAAAAVVLALVVISQSGGDQQKTAPPERGETAAGAAEVNRLLAGIPQRGTVLGDPAAPVTLTEFADLQCPFCGMAATESLPTVIERYVRPGKVKLDLRLLSFLGDDSVRGASMAAAAAEQGKLWQYVELFYRNQGEENSGYVTDSFLRTIASGVRGLDADRALSAARGAAAERQVAEWTRDGDGVRETPTFLLTRGGGEAEQIEIDPSDPASFTRPLDSALGG